MRSVGVEYAEEPGTYGVSSIAWDAEPRWTGDEPACLSRVFIKVDSRVFSVQAFRQCRRVTRMVGIDTP